MGTRARIFVPLTRLRLYFPARFSDLTRFDSCLFLLPGNLQCYA
jgi:hypothetical protein